MLARPRNTQHPFQMTGGGVPHGQTLTPAQDFSGTWELEPAHRENSCMGLLLLLGAAKIGPSRSILYSLSAILVIQSGVKKQSAGQKASLTLDLRILIFSRGTPWELIS